MKVMIEKLNQCGIEAGLTMNIEKAKILSRKGDLKEIIINGGKIEMVEEASYLGQIIALEKRTEKEINARIAKTWTKYWTLKKIFKGLSQHLKKVKPLTFVYYRL